MTAILTFGWFERKNMMDDITGYINIQLKVISPELYVPGGYYFVFVITE